MPIIPQSVETPSQPRDWSCRETESSEIYPAPDRRSELVLAFEREPPWRAPVFEARVKVGGREIRLPGSYQSAGRYGRGLDRFVDNPFSPDSQRIALVKRLNGDKVEIRLIETKTGKARRKILRKAPTTFHSWSPDSKYGLFQVPHAWLVVDLTREVEAEVPSDELMPRHAALLDGGALLAYSDSRAIIEHWAPPHWESASEAASLDLARPVYSYPDNGGLTLGYGVDFSSSLRAEGWIRCRLHREAYG